MKSFNVEKYSKISFASMVSVYFNIPQPQILLYIEVLNKNLLYQTL